MRDDNIVEYLCKNTKYTKEELANYLKRLEDVEKIANSNEYNGVVHLKNMYYRKYLIKRDDIPSEELGNSVFEMSLEEEIEEILCSQKYTLDMWLDYLLCKDVLYPEWFKFFIFQGVVSVGEYDDVNGIYKERTKNTTAPFLGIDYEVLAFIYDSLCKFFENKLNDQELIEIIKEADFKELYNYCFKKVELKAVSSIEDLEQIKEIDNKLVDLNKRFEEVEIKLREFKWNYDNNLEKIREYNDLYTEVFNEINKLKDIKFWVVSLVKYNDNIELRKSFSNKNSYKIFLRGTHICVGEISYRQFHFAGYLGDIGYEIGEEFRGNGYAYQALELLGEKLYEENVPNFLISTYDYNIPSKKTIEKYGGKLDTVDGNILIYSCDTRPCREKKKNK